MIVHATPDQARTILGAMRAALLNT